MAFINDGFKTLINLSNYASGVDLYYKERDVTPPGWDGGGENDTTTMRNTAFRTKQPKGLISLMETVSVVQYDTKIYGEIQALMNVNTVITITFPDLATLHFRGWLDKFIPNALVEGEMGTATITIIPANQTAAGVEAAPVYQLAGA